MRNRAARLARRSPPTPHHFTSTTPPRQSCDTKRHLSNSHGSTARQSLPLVQNTPLVPTTPASRRRGQPTSFTRDIKVDMFGARWSRRRRPHRPLRQRSPRCHSAPPKALHAELDAQVLPLRPAAGGRILVRRCSSYVSKSVPRWPTWGVRCPGGDATCRRRTWRRTTAPCVAHALRS